MPWYTLVSRPCRSFLGSRQPLPLPLPLPLPVSFPHRLRPPSTLSPSTCFLLLDESCKSQRVLELLCAFAVLIIVAGSDKRPALVFVLLNRREGPPFSGVCTPNSSKQRPHSRLTLLDDNVTTLLTIFSSNFPHWRTLSLPVTGFSTLNLHITIHELDRSNVKLPPCSCIDRHNIQLRDISHPTAYRGS